MNFKISLNIDRAFCVLNIDFVEFLSKIFVQYYSFFYSLKRANHVLILKEKPQPNLKLMQAARNIVATGAGKDSNIKLKVRIYQANKARL